MDQRNNTFRHEIAYCGKEIFEQRGSKKFILCGVGALGSNLLNLLLRQGYSCLHVVDFDKVEEHNISTQIYGRPEVGSSKVNACRSRFFRDLGIQIEAVNQKLVSSNTKKFFKDVNLVIDTFDNFESRRIIQKACHDLKVPCVHAGMSDDGFSEVKWNDFYKIPEKEIKQVDVCEYPLAVNLVFFTVTILAEAINNFLKEGAIKNYEFTLRDLKISSI